jgi:uncharacterized iron-regulated membrane protein
MSFRTVLFWCHLVLGISAGVVIFIMSFTGVILTYEKQMLAWADARAAAIVPPHPATPRASIDDIAAAVSAQWPDAQITTITQRADAAAPVVVALGNGKTVLAQPYSGEVLGEAPTRLRRVFRSSTEWHRYLAGTGERRTVGKAFTGASNLVFLFIVLSGLYLWMPKRWTRTALAAVTIPRWRHATPKARDFNWHNIFGFWCAIPLVIVVASATVISYPWASDLAYRVVGEAPPPRAAAPAPARPATTERQSFGDLDLHWKVAEAHVHGWRTISLRAPASAASPVVFTIDEGWPGQPQKRGTLTLDAQSGAVVRWDTFEGQSAGRRLRSLLRFAHTGEVWGIPGQTIAGLASLGACVLFVTGVALACRRLAASRRRGSARTLPKAA